MEGGGREREREREKKGWQLKRVASGDWIREVGGWEELAGGCHGGEKRGGFIEGTPNLLSNERVNNLEARSVHKVVIDLQMDVGGAAAALRGRPLQCNYRPTKAAANCASTVNSLRGKFAASLHPPISLLGTFGHSAATRPIPQLGPRVPSARSRVK